MSEKKKSQSELENLKISLKITTLWTSFMFLYIYVDYFHLFMPNKIDDIRSGNVFIFDITQEFLLVALASVTIPALMIFLSASLPAKINRWVNIIIATLYIPFTLFNLSGDYWTHMILGAIIEVVILLLIIFYAWKIASY